MLEDLRRPVVGRDQDVGKRLVVAQQHVEARPQPLDQIGFQQQRFGLGLGGDEFHRHRARDHAHDAAVVPGRPRIGGDPLLDVLRLADVEHLALRIDHAIDAGRRGRVLDRARDRGAAGRQRAGPLPLLAPARAAPARRPRGGRWPGRCLWACRSWGTKAYTHKGSISSSLLPNGSSTWRRSQPSIGSSSVTL